MVAIACFPVAAEASVGVGIQENPVSLLKAAEPGRTYALPAVHVADTGSQDESIVLKVERISGGHARTVPATWIHFANTLIQLSPHQETKISLDLVVPDTARAGHYLSDVVVIGSAVAPSKAANFRAAAATKLEFRVLPRPKPGLLASVPAWAWLAVAALLLTLFWSFARGRYIVNFSIKRKQEERVDAANPGGSNG